MAKFQKIFLIVFTVFLLIPNFCVVADQTSVPSIFSSYGIWNEAYSDFVTTTSSNTESIINWANAEYTPTNITVGFNFDMIPNITYSVEYHLHSDNGTRFKWLNTSRGDPVAVYSDQDMISGLPYSSYEDVLFNEENLIASSTVFNSSAAMAPYDVTFITYLKSSEYLSGFESSYKYITFRPDVTDFDPTDASYRITFSTLNIYYDPNDISEETLVQLNEQVEALKQLGIKVDLTNTLLEDLTEEVTKGLEDVKKAVENVGEDVANNIANMEKEEGNKAQDQAGDDADAMLGDLSDSDEVGGLDIVGKIKKFWNMLSSTDTADSMTFPSASNPFTGDLFWEEQTVDFSPWLNNVYVGYILKVARLLTSLGLFWWILKLYYSLVNSVLNKDSERSPIQVVLGLNPFK